MTVAVTITAHFGPNLNDYLNNVRVMRCTFTDEGIHVEDGIILKPGESTELELSHNQKIAIEEEWYVETQTAVV